MTIKINIMPDADPTLTRLFGVTGKVFAPRDLRELARQLIERANDAQRSLSEMSGLPRHELTPSFIEFPDPPAFDESADFSPASGIPTGAGLPIGIDSEGGSHD